MASDTSPPATNSASLDAAVATLPPIKARHPTSTPDAEADAHNMSILAVRGIHTAATGDTLYELAEMALQNHEFDAVPRGLPSSIAAATEQEPSTSSEESAITFEPFYFFFYGSLQIPTVLGPVVADPYRDSTSGTDDPEDDVPDNTITYLKNASIKGWKVRMWGPYPALVPADDGTVRGAAWLCEKPEYVPRLESYESDAYRMAYCDISVPYADGSGVEILWNARTFVSDLDDDELEDGEFDIDEYLENMVVPF
ncbi:hypothetical protein O1611_g3077 [Lasiodiplodia mahajangana]|uniref:Uncharacterized protein n=1 Tax=Lasiodiplodia mahajangana TaxID=1108764 RepID=A0ACC2JSR9_9PEZI|nr:hypothetical protein O1611_g3077 [Lasiodiplodia mahajangana]